MGVLDHQHNWASMNGGYRCTDCSATITDDDLRFPGTLSSQITTYGQGNYGDGTYGSTDPSAFTPIHVPPGVVTLEHEDEAVSIVEFIWYHQEDGEGIPNS